MKVELPLSAESGTQTPIFHSSLAAFLRIPRTANRQTPPTPTCEITRHYVPLDFTLVPQYSLKPNNFKEDSETCVRLTQLTSSTPIPSKECAVTITPPIPLSIHPTSLCRSANSRQDPSTAPICPGEWIWSSELQCCCCSTLCCISLVIKVRQVYQVRC